MKATPKAREAAWTQQFPEVLFPLEFDGKARLQAYGELILHLGYLRISSYLLAQGGKE